MATLSLPKDCNYLIHALYFSDDGSPLCRQMLGSYNASISPGTRANRKKQAEEYIRFSLILPYLQPSITHICMFAQHLANKHAAPTSVRNYLSGAKTWIAEHQGSVLPFLSPQLGNLVKGFVKNSAHIPARAEPLCPHHIRFICRELDLSPSAPLGVKLAILLGYSCFLRTSNLLSPTMLDWGGPHTLLAGEITLLSHGLSVHIRSTKTRSNPLGLDFIIPRSSDPSSCPVQAWTLYKAAVRPWPLGPAFVHGNGLPITSAQVVRIMRAALVNHRDITPKSISMHSLRRGATQAAVDQEVPLQDILSRGTWKSTSGMQPYLRRQSASVPTVTVCNLA